MVEVTPSVPTPLMQSQQQWLHRTPYIYIPSENKIYWGHPGTTHGQLAWNISTQHGIPHTRDAWYGSIYQHPVDPNLWAHSIHRWRLDRDPEEENRLEAAIGIPIDPHVGPEWLQDDFAPEDWVQRIPTQRIAADPKDWKERYDYHAPVEGKKHCGTCAAYKNGYCEMFDDQVYASYVCTEWTDSWKPSESD